VCVCSVSCWWRNRNEISVCANWWQCRTNCTDWSWHTAGD